jgi:CubicO group peptidase (beta-lactamase class C family)
VIRRRVLRTVAVIGLIAAVAAGTWLGVASILYTPEYVFRTIAWGESDVGDYLAHFPQRVLHASSSPFAFQAASDQSRGQGVAEEAFGVDDLASFLQGTQTQAFIVIHGDTIVLERYVEPWTRDAMVTSFSVAKSFVSTLVGIAIDEGAIGGLDDPITMYLPELAERDPAFAKITIRHVLTMSSGLAYDADGWFVFNGDDPLTTYHPDQRHLALTNIRIAGPPGQTFSYNKYHPQLLGMILERTTGQSVTEWTQSKLWDPLGMEYDGAWALDSEASGFEKMEAGLNARAVDFAKLGRLFLHSGEWEGQEVVSPDWVAMATGTDPEARGPLSGPGRYYGFMWWGVENGHGPPDCYAFGDHGQFIFVSPRNDAVIVRNGTDFGMPTSTWISGFRAIAEGL